MRVTRGSRTTRAKRQPRAVLLTALVAFASLTAGCAPSAAPVAPTSAPPASTAPAPTSTPTPTPAPTPTPTPDPLEGLSLEQQVGQLFVVGTAVDTVTPAAMSAVTDRSVGGIFLHGRTSGGLDAVAPVVAAFTAQATAGIGLWVSTDQEGGEVQVLRGAGFDDIPYAIRQADNAPDVLEADAARWGGQLAAAGVNLNLAPVADIVTSHDTRFDNAPIGALGRQYGYDEQTVAAHAGAFAEGMRQAGVLPTLKHFPGLGHVTANPDVAADVHDTVVGADSPDVDVYRSLTAAGPALVMVGTAIYDRIDPDSPAALSAPVVTGVLRDQLGFTGVVITDDLSAAAAVTVIAPADRALRALDAGVDVLLVSADPSVLPAMYDAVLARAQSDPAFAERVAHSARRVIEAKAAL